MELMHKEARYSGGIQVRDVRRWPLDSKPVKFLLMTETARSIKTLQEVEKTLPYHLPAF